MADTVALMLSTLRRALETNGGRLLREAARLDTTVDRLHHAIDPQLLMPSQTKLPASIVRIVKVAASLSLMDAQIQCSPHIWWQITRSACGPSAKVKL